MIRRIGGAAVLALVAFACAGATAAAAPTWLPAEGPFGESEGRLGAATMSPDGTVTAARLVPTMGSEAALEVRVRPPGGSFGPAEPIDPSASLLFAPVLVAAGDGSVALVYAKGGGAWASIRPPGGSFGAPRLLSTTGSPTAAAVAFEAGRVWFVHPQGSSFLASTLGPSGSASDLLVDTAPAEFAPTWASVGLAPDGQLRVAYEFDTGERPTSSSTCFETEEIREADGGAFGFGAASTLDTATATGGVFLGSCDLLSGESVGPPSLAATSDGATAVAYVISQLFVSSTAAARFRPAGGSWPAAASPAETVATGMPGSVTIAAAGAVPFAAITSIGSPDSIALSSRDPDGSWTTPQTVTGAAGGEAAQVAASPRGAAVVAWQQPASPYEIEAVVRSPSGALSPAQPVSGSQDRFSPVGGVGVDDGGDAVVGWENHVGADPTSGFRALIAGYDGAGPRFTSLEAPASGVAGQALGFSASAVDVWSPVGPTSWQFGDGAGASGGAVSHAFGPGSYTVSASATDALGNTTTETRPLSVSAAPTAPVAPGAVDTAPPRLTKLALRPRKVKRGKVATLSFTLSEAATVRVTVARGAKGVKRGGSCVKAAPKAQGRAKPCRRLVAVRKLAGKFGAGAATLALPKTLALGRYVVSAVATDAAGNSSAPLTAPLTVVAAGQR